MTRSITIPSRLALCFQLVAAAHAEGVYPGVMGRNNDGIAQTTVPAWVLRAGGVAASVQCNFSTGLYWYSNAVHSSCPVSTSRASPETCTWSSGLLTYVGNNVPCITDLGFQSTWEGRTNDALWSSDLTQSGTWTATSITTAKNATGPDNIANSASTITASAGSGTILQAITLASQADTYSVSVMCVTCTGTISIAEYPSGTPAFTALTASNCFNQNGVGTAPNTSAWVVCQAEATVLNPVIGFKITNSGDSIRVFCNQLEPGAFRTACIPTTTASVARAADSSTATGVLASIIESGTASIAAKIQNIPSTAQNAPVIGRSAADVFMRLLSSTQFQNRQSSVNLTATLSTGTIGASAARLATGWNAAGRSLVGNGGTVVSDSTAPGTNTSAQIGSFPAGTAWIDGNLPVLAAFANTRLSDPALQSMSGGTW